MPFVKISSFLLIASLLLANSGICEASEGGQGRYEILTLEDFNAGVIPETLPMGHSANQDNVLSFAYASAQGMPGLITPLSSVECGSSGVAFQPSTENPHLSLFSKTTLERARLGENGRALYQADYYIPEEGQPLPNIAMLAAVMKTNEDKPSYAFYRFGLERDGKNLFFSFTNNTPQPVDFRTQPAAEFGLVRPGWNRFQIIFVGQNEIVCAVNGKPTSFSPILEGTLTRLNPGLMVTIGKDPTSSALADNLSIQFSAEDAPLPDSPWTMAATATQSETLLEPNPDLLWYTDPSAAWKAGQAQRKPILVLFYVPSAAPYANLKKMVPYNDEAKALLQKFILLRVDVNQLAGGKLAQRRKVFRVPTLLVFGVDGQEKTRIQTTAPLTTWESIKADLEK